MDNMVPVVHIMRYVASEYQGIHPYSAINIDSVKINTSLNKGKVKKREELTNVSFM